VAYIPTQSSYPRRLDRRPGIARLKNIVVVPGSYSTDYEDTVAAPAAGDERDCAGIERKRLGFVIRTARRSSTRSIFFIAHRPTTSLPRRHLRAQSAPRAPIAVLGHLP
jgi:hypothetical protein